MWLKQGMDGRCHLMELLSAKLFMITITLYKLPFSLSETNFRKRDLLKLAETDNIIHWITLSVIPLSSADATWTILIQCEMSLMCPRVPSMWEKAVMDAHSASNCHHNTSPKDHTQTHYRWLRRKINSKNLKPSLYTLFYYIRY